MDLVGGPPFGVLESDPGVFTSLTRKLGVEKLSLVELYDIEPWATDHLKPHGLIFCFNWRDEVLQPTEFETPEQVWFANQLSADACGTFAFLNVLLNCPSVHLGEHLEQFKNETKEMSPVMKGLAVTNSTFIRNAHNSFARPADLRGSLNTIASTTLDAQKMKAKAKPVQQPSKKGPKAKPTKAKPEAEAVNGAPTNGSALEDLEEAYHYIGYTSVAGKVWELDGLKPFPLEVGELSSENATWLDVARPALRMKMEKYGGGASEEAANIRFSLLAIIDGAYEQAHDEWYWWVKERQTIENELRKNNVTNWEAQVDPELLAMANDAFTADSPGRRLLSAGAQRMERDIEIMSAAPDMLPKMWENSVREALRTKVGLEDEVRRATDDWTEHIKRTHDYEPFIVEYVKSLHMEGLLDVFLDSGKKVTKKAKSNEGRAHETKVKTTYHDPEEEDELPDAAEDNDEDWKPTSSRRK
ncbi:hypothetical protein GYMLUDRAFT_82583 [Collybiopsis luxurians FD-317 M1]|nr:hypothetical protein GYMLUDRAFT_82583 [Collybiopsis luxurians FD-317 M1]